MKARLPHDFIIKLKQYDLINVLFHISIYSSKLFHNSDDDLTAARRETLRLGSLGKQEKSQQRPLWSRQAQKERAFTSLST